MFLPTFWRGVWQQPASWPERRGEAYEAILKVYLYNPADCVVTTQFSRIGSILFFVVRHFQTSYDTIFTDRINPILLISVGLRKYVLHWAPSLWTAHVSNFNS
jgi:hypothetical protein